MSRVPCADVNWFSTLVVLSRLSNDGYTLALALREGSAGERGFGGNGGPGVADDVGIIGDFFGGRAWVNR